MFLDISNKHIVEHYRKLLSFVVVLVLVVVFVRRGLVVVVVVVARGRSWSLVVARGRSWSLVVVLVVLVRRGLVVGVVASLSGRGRGPRRVSSAIVTFLLGLWGGRAFLVSQSAPDNNPPKRSNSELNHHKPETLDPSASIP